MHCIDRIKVIEDVPVYKHKVKKLLDNEALQSIIHSMLEQTL